MKGLGKRKATTDKEVKNTMLLLTFILKQDMQTQVIRTYTSQAGEAGRWEHTRTNFRHGRLTKGMLLPLLPPSFLPEQDPLHGEQHTGLAARCGATMEKHWGQGLSRMGVTGRMGSPAAPPSLQACGDMDPLMGLLIGVGLTPCVRNGKSDIKTGSEKWL